MRRVGHRGDPRHAPENTLVSLETAWRHGRRAIECDVRATRDGVPIVFHDETLNRVTRERGAVARRTWASLRRVDAGSWFSPRFAGEPICSLEQVLAVFRRRPLVLFLDLKVTGLELAVHQLVHRFGMADRCRVASSHLHTLSVFQALGPSLPVYQVTGYRQRVSERVLERAEQLELTGLLVYRRWITPAMVRSARHRGLEVYVWTVREGREERHMQRCGVTGVMTERCLRSM